jgi:hypothetical protein
MILVPVPKNCMHFISFLVTVAHCSIGFRSIKLDGEVTSVKVSQNSQYALINNAPDVSGHFMSAALVGHSIGNCIGNKALGPPCWEADTQIHGSISGTSCHPELLWRDRR